jgi:type IV secretory pathway VirB10-like protein
MEKKQTNHWFVAYDQGGELRVSGWNSRNRLRPGSKHLCGQTCLHKLVDDFMARALTARPSRAAQNDLADDLQDEILEQAVAMDASLTSGAAFKKTETAKRPIKTVAPVPQTVAPAPQTVAPAPAAAPPPAPPAPQAPLELVVVPASPRIEEAAAADEPPRFTSRNWRAAAWDRERERESRAGEHHAGVAFRRRFS